MWVQLFTTPPTAPEALKFAPRARRFPAETPSGPLSERRGERNYRHFNRMLLPPHRPDGPQATVSL